jgi:hypothetical protein
MPPGNWRRRASTGSIPPPPKEDGHGLAFENLNSRLETLLGEQPIRLAALLNSEGATLEHVLEEVFDVLSREVRTTTEQAASDVIDASREQLKAQANMFDFKLQTQRTASEVTLNNKLCEMQATGAKEMKMMSSNQDAKIASLQAQLAEANEAADAAVEAARVAEETLAKTQKLIYEAAAEKEQAERRERKLSTDLETIDTSVQGAVKEMGGNREENESCLELIKRVPTVAADSMSIAVEEARAETEAQVARALSVQQKELDEVKAELHKLKNGAAAVNRSASTQIQALKDEIQRAQNAVKDALKSLNLKEMEVKTLGELIDDLSRRYKQSERDSKEAKASLEEIYVELGLTKQENVSLSERVREIVQMHEAACQELEQLKLEREQINQMKAELEAISTSLSAALSSAGVRLRDDASLHEKIDELINRFTSASEALDKANREIETLMGRLRKAAKEKAASNKQSEAKVKETMMAADKERAKLATAALKALQSLSSHLTHTLSGLRGQQPIGGLRGAQMQAVNAVYPTLVRLVTPAVRHAGQLPSVVVSPPPNSARRPQTSPQDARRDSDVDLSLGSGITPARGMQHGVPGPPPLDWAQLGSPRSAAHQHSPRTANARLRYGDVRTPGAAGKWPDTYESLLPTQIQSAPPMRREGFVFQGFS